MRILLNFMAFRMPMLLMTFARVFLWRATFKTKASAGKSLYNYSQDVAKNVRKALSLFHEYMDTDKSCKWQAWKNKL